MANAVATANVNANLTYDIAATESARLAAAEAVKPVGYQKGQNIVQKGEIISEAQMRLIKQMGLMTDKNSGVSRWVFSGLLMGRYLPSRFYIASIRSTASYRTRRARFA